MNNEITQQMYEYHCISLYNTNENIVLKTEVAGNTVHGDTI